MLIEHVTMEGKTHATEYEIRPRPTNPLIVEYWFWDWVSEYPDC